MEMDEGRSGIYLSVSVHGFYFLPLSLFGAVTVFAAGSGQEKQKDTTKYQ